MYWVLVVFIYTPLTGELTAQELGRYADEEICADIKMQVVDQFPYKKFPRLNITLVCVQGSKI